MLDRPLNISTYSTKSKNLKQTILKNAKILPPDQDCIALVSVSIENLINVTVPKWIKQKLVSSGITPLNNLMDFQNYILLETGYPFAFYDFDKINSKLNNSELNLSISKAENNQKFLASNGNTYTLDNSILLVKANQIPISIAGIIENQEFSY